MDNIYLKSLDIPGYELYNVPGLGAAEGYGGIAVLHKSTLKPISQRTSFIRSFEYCDLVFKSGQMCFTLCVVYQAPPTKSNQLSLSHFFEDFPEFLQEYVTSQGKLILVGDINFHLDDLNDYYAKRFMSLITRLNLKQLVNEPTHQLGHTLDVVITRENDDFVRRVKVLD